MRVPPLLQAHPAHQAGQPPLPTRNSGPVHPDQLHRDQGRTWGPVAGRRRWNGETRSWRTQGYFFINKVI